MMLVEKSFDTGEVVLNYAEGPDNGPPILFIHGLTGDWRRFLPIMPSVTMRWHVYAVDLRGHGKSGHTKGHYTLQDGTRDLEAFIEKVINRPTVLFGHSLGGILATMLAADNPEVIAVILGDPPQNYDGSWRRDIVSKIILWRQAKEVATTGRTVPEVMKIITEKKLMWGGIPMEDPMILLSIARRWSRMDPDLLTLMIESEDDLSKFEKLAEGYDNERLFPRIRCPVMLLRGNPKLGGVISDEEAEMARELVPNLTYVYFDTLGHALFPVGAEPVLSKISIFLESLR